MSDGSAPGADVLLDSFDLTVYTAGLSETRNGVSKYYHEDSLGSTRGLTDAGQTPTDSLLFDAFGVPQYRSGTKPTPYGFAGADGYQRDTDSGLMLCGYRYYNPATGRFLTSDPAGAGNNWYAYCDNDPLNATDPGGLWPKSIDGVDISGGAGFRDAGAPGSPNNMGPGHYELEVLFRDGEYSYLGYDIEGLLTTITGATYHLGYVWVTDAGDAANWTGVIAQWVDESATFGLAGKAGTAWGDVDSGHGSVGTATLLTAGVIGAVGLAALTDGEDAAAINESKVLVRFGEEAETIERLAEQASAAESKLGVHGVSVRDAATMSKNRPMPTTSATVREIIEHFPVHKTGGRGHYTVELPNPLSQADVDVFNQLFGL